MADSPVSFPDVPWATEVAKDYSNLGGQLRIPGVENGSGPFVYGQWLDPYTQGEHIRDHLLRAVYGTFSNVKLMEPDSYANLEFDHVAYVAAQGQFMRYKGDYVLSETDIRMHKYFPDAVVQNGGAFCLHYPGDKRYHLRLKHWTWDERYDIPFRCLYSANISNLMMAGKHFSATHIGGSNANFMGSCGQHAIATAAAAHLCKKYNKTPRDVCQDHVRELQVVAAEVTGTDCAREGQHTISARL